MKQIQIQKANDGNIYDIHVDGEWYKSFTSPRNVFDTLEELSENDSIQIQFDGSPAGLVTQPELKQDQSNLLELTRSESGMFDLSVNGDWLASRTSPDNVLAILAEVSDRGPIQMEYNDTPEERLNRSSGQTDLSLSEADLAGISEEAGMEVS